MILEDSSIAQRLCLADQRDAAMADLVRIHGERLYQRIADLVGSGSDADDVFQDSLVKILRFAKDFDGRSQFFSWLYRIVTNQSLDFLRARQRRSKHTILEGDFSSSQESDHNHQPTTQGVNSDQAQALLLKAISELPEQQRLVFEERYYHETPYGELAKRLGKSEGGLKANYHHAVQKVTAFIHQHAELFTS